MAYSTLADIQGHVPVSDLIQLTDDDGVAVDQSVVDEAISFADELINGYLRVRERNSRYNEQRAFINFVDGIGWLARKADYRRLVEECHYFSNFRHLEMLDSVVLKHIPKKYLKKNK